MGCGSCGSGACTAGCGQNGGCATGGCNKLNTYDWLGNMLPPDKTEVDNVYEVRFKNTRKEFYRNVNGLRLFIGDPVVVESDRGFDVGTLSLGGVMAQLQMRKKKVRGKEEDLPRIYRKANEEDLELLKEARAREQSTMVRTRKIIADMRLEMKLSDVEFQGDNTKAIFYYIADHRVDFRELIKVLAREFHIRVEMRQIGLRHEAGLVGGIGSCGRELCCSTWLTDFRTVSTSAARYQNLSLNPMKISGMCGRLKCCLNYELDAYLDALKDFPKVNRIETARGTANLEKTDIFKGRMWFSYKGDATWYPMDTDEVKRIHEMNKRGEKPEAIIAPSIESEIKDDTSNLDFVDGVGSTEIKEEKKRRRGGKKKRSKKKKGGRNRQQNTGAQGQKDNQPQNRGGRGGKNPGNRNKSQGRGKSQKRGDRNKGRGPKSGGDEKKN